MTKQPQALTVQDPRIVAYKARDGQEITLSMEIVKNFLVVGNKELVTLQEFVFFMGVCRARGLNPFAKDCYLIKYSQDPAAIVTAIDFYRARARVQKDCHGWQKGVICLNNKTGELRYSKGLVLPNDEEIVGGWFKAQPAGWDVPFELEVNLSGYIKRTKDGVITRFWQPANQATMIAKVAESQGLRTLWPDEFRGTITGEEAGLQLDNFDALDITDLQVGGPIEGEDPPKVDTSVFDALLKAKGLSPERLARVQTFIEETAKSQKKTKATPDQIKARAGGDFDRFWDVFEKWEAKRFPEAGAATDKIPGIAPGEEAPAGGTIGGAETPPTGAEASGDSEPPFADAPPETVKSGALDLEEVERVWRIVATKGIPLTELKEHTGAGGKPEITAENLPQVSAYAQAYVSPKGKK